MPPARIDVAAPHVAPPKPPPSRGPSFSTQISYGALALGIGSVMLPMVMTMMVVFLPMQWVFGASGRR